MLSRWTFKTHGVTALLLAAQLGREDCVKMLLKLGADVNKQNDKLEWAGLTFALIFGNEVC